MPRTNIQLEIGNLVVKFGDSLNLLDMFREVVQPAFLDATLLRQYTDTKYLFLEVKLVLLNEVGPVLGITGRFVKDTILEQQQVLEGGQLVEASGTLPSAPSSIFLLILNTHRLLFVKQHIGSPSMDSFRSTLSNFLKKKHRQFIDATAKIANGQTGEKPTKFDLVKRFPYPSVELTPIASQQSVEQFLSKFAKLQVVTTQLLTTNSEFDNEGLFTSVRLADRRIKSKKTTLRYENKEGLNITEAAEQVAELAKQGNHEVNFSGRDPENEKLSGNNEKFKLHIPLNNLPEEAAVAAPTLYEHYEKVVKNQIITVPPTSDAVKQKVAEISSGSNL